MVICFPGFYIKLYIIYMHSTNGYMCIELYTYNPNTQSYACIIKHYKYGHKKAL